MFPYPSGAGPARRPLRGLHGDRHHHALEADAGLERPAPDGLGRLRPARRELRHQARRPPAHHHRRRPSPTSAARSTPSASPTTGSARSTRPIPAYVKWTQWIFLQLFKRDLAYEGVDRHQLVPVVQDRPRQRRGQPGALRALRHASSSARTCASGCCASRATPTACSRTWRELDWPESTLAMQRNWIGRSEGAEVAFHTATPVAGPRDPRLHDAARHAVRRDVHGAGARAPAGRRADDARRSARRSPPTRRRRAARATSSAPTWPRRRPASSPARRARNPVNGDADPDLDRRLRAGELRHRRHHGGARRTTSATSPSRRSSVCPSSQVVQPSDGAQRSRRGECRSPTTASPSTRARSTGCRRPRPSATITARARGGTAPASATVSYRLRDWVFSRQRYWGEPIPLIHCPTDGVVAVPETRAARARCPTSSATRRPARASRRWPRSTAGSTPPARSAAGPRSARPTPCRSGRARAGTTCATSTRRTPSAPSTRRVEQKWMPVDLYVGGGEHAVLHLLYARFWHKVLFDMGARRRPRSRSRSCATRARCSPTRTRTRMGRYHELGEVELPRRASAMLQGDRRDAEGRPSRRWPSRR